MIRRFLHASLLCVAGLAAAGFAALTVILSNARRESSAIEQDGLVPEFEIPAPTPRDIYAAGLPPNCELIYYREPMPLDTLAEEHFFRLTGQGAASA